MLKISIASQIQSLDFTDNETVIGFFNIFLVVNRGLKNEFSNSRTASVVGKMLLNKVM